MTVSLIVGTMRTMAKFAPRRPDLLSELNERLQAIALIYS